MAARSRIATSPALSYVNMNIAGTGESLTLGSLTSYSGGDITVSGGATLSLPGLTGYAGYGNTTTLEATGTGSALTLANLATITESANSYGAITQFEALAGGTVTLPACTRSTPARSSSRADGASSLLNVPALDRLHRGQRLDLLDTPGHRRRHGQ